MNLNKCKYKGHLLCDSCDTISFVFSIPTQKDNINKLTQVPCDVVQALCPQLLPDALLLSKRYNTLFRLFADCLKQYNSASMFTDEDIKSLGK